MQLSSIVVLGGPSAGKTVYLAALYQHLWRGYAGMLMRASNGTTHTELLKCADDIASGRLPPATQALRDYDFEFEHDGRVYHLHYLDYPGELFRKIFYEMAVDGEEATRFHGVCSQAAGVIVLLDPASVGDITYDVDYAMSNLVRYYRENGSNPKFVIALTKRDENEQLIRHGVAAFLKSRLPHTARLLRRGVHLMHFCSIVRSRVSIQFAAPDVVCAPLSSVVNAIEEEEHRRGLALVMRHAAIKETVRGTAIKIGIACGLLLAMTGAFYLGVLVRRLTGT
ncbi:MAG: hypothetical protein AB1716_03905 [Planctomycetota bacterium]